MVKNLESMPYKLDQIQRMMVTSQGTRKAIKESGSNIHPQILIETSLIRDLASRKTNKHRRIKHKVKE